MRFQIRYRYAIYDNEGTFLEWKSYVHNKLPQPSHNVKIARHSQPIDSIDHTIRKVWLKTGPVVYAVIADGNSIGSFSFTLYNYPRRGAEITIGDKYYLGVKANHETKTITAEENNKPGRK